MTFVHLLAWFRSILIQVLVLLVPPVSVPILSGYLLFSLPLSLILIPGKCFLLFLPVPVECERVVGDLWEYVCAFVPDLVMDANKRYLKHLTTVN